MTTNSRSRDYVYAPNDVLYEYHDSLTTDMRELENAKDELTTRIELDKGQDNHVRQQMLDDYINNTRDLSKNKVHGLDTANHKEAVSELGRMSQLRDERISAHDVLTLHRTLFDGILQNPEEVGRWRTRHVGVGGAAFTPSEPVDIPIRMDDYNKWLVKSTLPPHVPFVVASVGHVWLTEIHPFVEGNGRTARLLSALVLKKAGFPLVSIAAADRDAYQDAVEASNDYDISDFLKLLLTATGDSLDRYEQLAREVKQGASHVSVAAQRVDNRIENETMNEYELWATAMKSLVDKFKIRSNAFNSKTRNINSGVYTWDVLPYHKFTALSNRHPQKRTGIFSIQFRSRRLRVRYQFFAEYSGDEMGKNADADITIIASRDDARDNDHQWDYVRLDDISGIPRPDIREFAYSTKTREWFVRRRDAIGAEPLDGIVGDFFDEVMQCEDFQG